MVKEIGVGRRRIEIRGFKWPRRSTNVTVARLLGEDEFGRWLGVARGEHWWSADRSRSGVFETPIVKLVPEQTYWTACFQPVDPLIDVDIVLPVRWTGGALEEIDLELDVVRGTDDITRVRDREEFDRVREAWPVPAEIVARVEETCEQMLELVEQGVEPFGDVGRSWLSRFMSEIIL
jgi:hypothetical protein